MSEVLVDIGCNLTHKQFAADRAEVIERARAAGVAHMIVTGLSADASQAALELSRALPALCCTAGVHPHHASSFDQRVRDEILALGRAAEVVAVGECGLDYERNFSPPAAQRHAFEAQLEIAAELGKPVFLHVRRAHEDFARILENARPRLHGGVVHCFTGAEAELERYLELGLCIGITGFICDERRGTHLWELVRRIPPDRLMVETDAPFLRPRGLPGGSRPRNEPALLPHVAASVARHAGKSPAEIWRSTTQTAFRLFGLGALFGTADR